MDYNNKFLSLALLLSMGLLNSGAILAMESKQDRGLGNFEVFPDEILDILIQKLDYKGLKNINFTSSYLQSLSNKLFEAEKAEQLGQALIKAIEQNKLDLAKCIINVGKANLNFKDKNGQTPFTFAFGKASLEIVELLLKNESIDVNIQNKDGQSVLFDACQFGLNELVEKLLCHKLIDPNLQNNKGETVLMQVSGYGNKEIVKLLLNHKDINVHIQDSKGNTALDFAGKNKIRKLIQDHIDKESKK